MRPHVGFVVAATALIAATYGLSRFGFGLFVPAIERSISLGPAMTGAISSASFFSYCIAAACAYRLARAPRVTVLLAGVLATLGSIGVALSGSALVLAVCILVAGAGAGFASPGLVALIQRNLDPAAESRAQAVVNSGTGFGVICAGPLALVLADQWRVAWWIIAGLNAAATIAVLGKSKRSQPESASIEPGTFRLSNLLPLRWAAAAALLAGVASAAVWTFSKSIVTAEGRISDAEATIFWVCLGSAGIAGAFSGDLVTRLGLRTSGTTTAALMGLSTLLVGLWPSSLVAVYAGGALFGASYVAFSGILIAWVISVLPEHAAAGTAALFITLALGQATGSLLMGVLLGATSPAAAFAIAAGIAFSSFIPLASCSGPGPQRSTAPPLSRHEQR
ncbi:MFS transporter [Arthrobacter sp. ISL-95]|uniref:MFS transporter n=1 Tax=Arthrobacter sp. ISL-95 TaxID=2819116 RepID=UPI001BE5A4F6|nr:MFS transporter [Arthrobacter sp. ISL-95]MBT2585276.1 MFS transporter [Arthrobacter sp. ISL-95]